MTGINRTGTSSTENFVLPRGCIFASEISALGYPIAWRLLGNATDFSISGDAETLEHFTNKTRTRTKDAELTLQTSFDFGVTLEEPVYRNLEIFFTGKSEVLATNAATAAALAGNPGIFAFPNDNPAATAPLDDTQVGGRYYDVYLDTSAATGPQIVVGSGGPTVTTLDHSDRVYDLDGAQLTLTVNGNVHTVASGAFTYDGEAGHIFVPSTSAMVADMTAASLAAAVGDPVVEAVAQYGADIVSQNMDQMLGGTSSSKSLALRFIMFNGNSTTETQEVTIFRTRLRPNGDLNLLTEDELMTVELSGSLEIEKGHDDDGAGLVTFRVLTV